MLVRYIEAVFEAVFNKPPQHFYFIVTGTEAGARAHL